MLHTGDEGEVEILSCNMSNTDICLSRGFQKHISDPTRAHGLLDHGKDRKCADKRKWTDREYHVQYRKYVPHTSVKMSCATTQFPALSC